MSTLGGLPTEQSFVKTDRWSLNLLGDFTSLPSIALGFLNQLTGDSEGFVVTVDRLMEVIVCLNGLIAAEQAKATCGDVLKARVGFVKALSFGARQRQKVQLKRLLHRYLPIQKIPSCSLKLETWLKLFPQFLPRINSWVSLRCFSMKNWQARSSWWDLKCSHGVWVLIPDFTIQ